MDFMFSWLEDMDFMFSWQEQYLTHLNFKNAVSPAKRCDLVSVQLEKVHNVFKFSAFVLWRGEIICMAQRGSFYYKRQSD